MRLWKLSESERNYTWRQWARVVWIAIRHPIWFALWVMKRREYDAKTPEQLAAEKEARLQAQRADAQRYVDAVTKWQRKHDWERRHDQPLPPPPAQRAEQTEKGERG